MERRDETQNHIESYDSDALSLLRRPDLGQRVEADTYDPPSFTLCSMDDKGDLQPVKVSLSLPVLVHLEIREQRDASFERKRAAYNSR